MHLNCGAGTPDRSEDPVQFVLPKFRVAVRSNPDQVFAHPAEGSLANLFERFGIRWAYEPTSFALPPCGEGIAGEWFTPDFYLPDYRLYIELTTMRQRLVTKKNRKVRRLIEAYPNVRVKIVYRRDFVRLMNCYRGAPAKSFGPRAIRVLVTGPVIEARIAEMAVGIRNLIENSTGSRTLTQLSLGTGVDRFQTSLRAHLERLGFTIFVFRIGFERRRSLDQRVRVSPRWPGIGNTFGKNPVILVTDMVSTGLSLAYVQRWLQRQGVSAAITCTLMDRTSARLLETDVAIRGFDAPNEVIVGYGFKLNPALANLPYIGAMDSNPLLDEILLLGPSPA